MILTSNNTTNDIQKQLTQSKILLDNYNLSKMLLGMEGTTQAWRVNNTVYNICGGWK